MSGMAIIIIGFVILILSTAGMAAAEWMLFRKKRRIREQVYHIYQ